jgi:hypothetical protein
MSSGDNFYCLKLFPSYEYGPGFQPAIVADFSSSLPSPQAQTYAKAFIQHQLEIPHEYTVYFSQNPMVVWTTHEAKPLLVLAQYVDEYRASGGRQKLSFLFLYADSKELFFEKVNQHWLELQTFSPFIVPEEIKVLATTEQLSKAVKKRLLPSRIEKLAQAPTEQKVFGLIGLVLFIIIGVKFKFIPVVPLNNFLDFNKMFRHFKP